MHQSKDSIFNLIEKNKKEDFDDAYLRQFKCVKDVACYMKTYLNKGK